MRNAFIVLLITCLSVTPSYAQSKFKNLLQKQAEENVVYNKTVTDQHIIEYLEFKYQIDPNMLAEFQKTQKDPEALKLLLTNYRKFHNDNGMQIATLEGLSTEDIERLKQILEFKKEEYYDSLEARRALENMPDERLRIILREGTRLIESYAASEKKSTGGRVILTGDYPSNLSFLNLKRVDLQEDYCRLFLQKGVGKGVGYSISKVNGEYKLWSFDEYDSWDAKEIEIRR